MEYGLLSLIAPVWELVVDNSSTTVPNTTADHTTSVRATPTTFPDTTTTTPPLPLAEARAGGAAPATYADKTVLLARAIEDGTVRTTNVSNVESTPSHHYRILHHTPHHYRLLHTTPPLPYPIQADRTVFYVTLCLCLLQLLVVLGMRFTRSCACKSTQVR